MHIVTTDQKNSHYFKFFKRPRWIFKEIGTCMVLEESDINVKMNYFGFASKRKWDLTLKFVCD